MTSSWININRDWYRQINNQSGSSNNYINIVIPYKGIRSKIILGVLLNNDKHPKITKAK